MCTCYSYNLQCTGILKNALYNPLKLRSFEIQREGDKDREEERGGGGEMRGKIFIIIIIIVVFIQVPYLYIPETKHV